METSFHLLRMIGMRSNYSGYNYLAYAISLVLENPDYLRNITRTLYGTVGEKYSVTNTGIAIAWLLRMPEKMQPIVGSINENRLADIAKAADIEITREDWYDIYRTAGYKLP